MKELWDDDDSTMIPATRHFASSLFVDSRDLRDPIRVEIHPPPIGARAPAALMQITTIVHCRAFYNVEFGDLLFEGFERELELREGGGQGW